MSVAEVDSCIGGDVWSYRKCGIGQGRLFIVTVIFKTETKPKVSIDPGECQVQVQNTR